MHKIFSLSRGKIANCCHIKFIVIYQNILTLEWKSTLFLNIPRIIAGLYRKMITSTGFKLLCFKSHLNTSSKLNYSTHTNKLNSCIVCFVLQFLLTFRHFKIISIIVRFIDNNHLGNTCCKSSESQWMIIIVSAFSSMQLPCRIYCNGFTCYNCTFKLVVVLVFASCSLARPK